jgi:chromosome transmission fidelity protein 4
MVWNNVGIVKCFGEEGDQSTSSIEVEFHDSSIHHGLHIPNTLGHTMASLSSQSLLLAGPAQEDSPSRIVCVNFAAWDGHKEWATTLPLGEDALAFSAGDAWVAVTTSRNLLRLFSNSGHLACHDFSPWTYTLPGRPRFQTLYGLISFFSGLVPLWLDFKR